MTSNLYLMSGSDAVSAKEHHYEREYELQRLIALNPHLVCQRQGDGSSKLMLVKQEFGVSDDTGLSLDHLFVDHSGIPVLVEVKRAVDTRIRREVVAQVIDYASCASAWDVSKLRQMFQETNSDDSDLLQQYDTDEFWGTVATNLKAEKLKLVFVADKIPGRLRNIIEFLDRNMTSIRVYGVEVRQFQTDDSKLVTSTVLENQVVEQQIQSAHATWTEQSMMEYIANRYGKKLMRVSSEFFHYAEKLGATVTFNSSSKPAFIAKLPDSYWFFRLSCWKKTVLIEIYVPNFIPRLGKDWSEAAFRSHIKAHIKNCRQYVNEGKKWVNINATAFLEYENFETFTSMMTTLYEQLTSD